MMIMKQEKLFVLLIDDDDSDAELMKRYLEEIEDWEIEYMHIQSLDENSQVELNKADIIFLDYLLGMETGLDILKKILNAGFSKPVIILTGQGDEEIAVESMKAGAYDYITKGRLSSLTLYRSIFNAMERYNLRQKVLFQEQALLEAERQRVMMESMGAAAHHFSQPLTGISGNLQLLGMDSNLNEEQRELIDRCLKLIGDMKELLDKFRQITKYRITPYINKDMIIDIR